MRVCLASGLRVPEDVAIIGFDDIAGASHAAPALSTIAVDKEALGRRGVELLLEETPATPEIVLPVRLIERASTCTHPPASTVAQPALATHAQST
jgi:DNA-binding LacI/PurR family transcriptional regulator